MSPEITAGSGIATEVRRTTSGVKRCRNNRKDAGGQQTCDQELGQVTLGVCLVNHVRYVTVLQASQPKFMVCSGGFHCSSSAWQLLPTAAPTCCSWRGREVLPWCCAPWPGVVPHGLVLCPMAWCCPGLPWANLAVSLPTLKRQPHVQPFSHPSGNAKDQGCP